MLIPHMMVDTLMLPPMWIRGLTTPMPQPRFLTQRLFIQVEQEERAVQAEPVEPVVRAEQVAPEEQVAQAVREQLAKEAEQVAEVLFS
jgi:hypothetical protein